MDLMQKHQDLHAKQVQGILGANLGLAWPGSRWEAWWTYSLQPGQLRDWIKCQARTRRVLAGNATPQKVSNCI